jgi:putative ABC transport system permease protein
VRARSVLVAAEIALALMLTVGAALLIRSVDGLQKSSLGVRTSDLLIVRLPLAAARGRGLDAEATTAYLERIVDRARSVPGVVAADVTSHVPLGGGGQAKRFRVVGRPLPANLEDMPRVSARQEGPDSLRVMGARLLRGRLFTEEDRANAAPVAIVSQTVARRFFAGEDPMGKVISFEPPENMAPPGYLEAAGGPFATWTIVGVVDDICYQHPSQPPEAVVHIPYRQRTRRALMGWAPEYLVLQTALQPSEVMSVLRKRVDEVAAAQPLAEPRDIRAVVHDAFRGTYLSTGSLAAFSLVALLLAAIGVYGSVASAVAARTQEIGVRMALGAQPASVVWLVLRQMTILATAGIVLGLVAAALSGRFIASQLYGVTPRDAISLLAIAALLAAWLPARRAAAIDPVLALRDY